MYLFTCLNDQYPFFPREFCIFPIHATLLIEEALFGSRDVQSSTDEEDMMQMQ